MSDWYRRSLPSRRVQLAFLLLIIGIDVVVAAVWLSIRIAWGAEAARVGTDFLIAISGILSTLSAPLLAVCRAERYPAGGSEYAGFLAGSPWTEAAATPFGPWHPVRKDVGILGVLGLLAASHLGLFLWLNTPDFIISAQPLFLPAVITATFLLPFVVFVLSWAVCGYVRVAIGWRHSILIPALTLGMLLHVGREIGALAVIPLAALTAIAGSIAVYRRMKSQLSQIPLVPTAVPSSDRSGRLSHANRQLCPGVPETFGTWLLDRMSGVSLLLSVVAGTLFAVPAWQRDTLIVLPLFVSLYGLFFAGVHLEVCAPHLGLAARWSRKQLRIPGYDRAFAPILWLALSSMAVLVPGYGLEIPPRLTVGVTVAVAVWVSLVTRVEIAEWSLTAPARFLRRPEQRRPTRGGGGQATNAGQPAGYLSESSHT
ncbi:MAG: hypothetical protein NXI04_05760 [Planctomycetaceae bacterium]|nr:hypothetical protein [Planctomycetaceae bacterium]